MENGISNTINLPDAPTISGLAFRHFSDARDFTSMAEILNAVSVVDQLNVVFTAEDMSNRFNKSNDFDPSFDIIVAEVDDIPVAFGSVETYQETNGTRVFIPHGRILPTWRRKGIGRAILHHNEKRLRSIAANQPSEGSRTFLTYAPDTNAGAAALLKSEGYQPVRHYYQMIRDSLDNIPNAPLPDGFEVRPALPAHYRQIWEAEQDAFQDHWGSIRATEDDYQRWLKDPYFNPTLWRIAWVGDEVVGQVRSFINPIENETYHRQRGYTEYISVRHAWRKRGLARALIAQSLDALKESGMKEATLRVDTENPSGALKLYESCGFRVDQSSTEYRKPLD